MTSDSRSSIAGLLCVADAILAATLCNARRLEALPAIPTTPPSTAHDGVPDTAHLVVQAPVLLAAIDLRCAVCGMATDQDVVGARLLFLGPAAPGVPQPRVLIGGGLRHGPPPAPQRRGPG